MRARMLPALLLTLALGCVTHVEPRPWAPAPGEDFSHALLDRVQRTHVDENGRVDYAALAEDRAPLDAYYRALADVSPKSHPDLFPTQQDELAYWINAYNAAVLVAVLEAWPIESVLDVKPAGWRPFLHGRTALAGFFMLQYIRLGGDDTNLLSLENKVIRAYGDPRIHFAINCASIGCPLLPQRAFTPAGLDAELDRETRRFFANPDKFRIDPETRTVWISSILDWFEKDFTAGGDADVLDYIRSNVTPAIQNEIDRSRDYEVEFIEYDWKLNGR
jgi:hypothetical protein